MTDVEGDVCECPACGGTPCEICSGAGQVPDDEPARQEDRVLLMGLRGVEPYQLMERDAWGTVRVHDAYLSPAAHCQLLDRGLVTGITSSMLYGPYDLTASGWRYAAALYEDGTGRWRNGISRCDLTTREREGADGV